MMMWKVEGTHFDPKRFTPLAPVELLYDFDGFRIFTFVDGNGELNLACWSDGDERIDRYVVTPTGKKIIQALKNGRMSVLQALDQVWCWVLDIDHSGNIVVCHRVDFDSIPKDALPAAGTLLLPDMKPAYGADGALKPHIA